ncbi:MAG: zf-HC2 domain-containing protein [Candidatus Eremiobacteraeota bacterium]|nr:zf-HC2 domain-containing protein [Candidatus Eremiobacteraeota bacterium]
MNCRDCQAIIVDYSRGELDAALDAALYEHAQSCQPCRASIRAERELIDGVRAAFGDVRDLPMSVLVGVRQAIRGQAAPSLRERWAVLFRPAVFAPVAALVAVFGLSISHFNQAPTGAPALSATYFVRQHVAKTLGSPASDRAWSAYLLTTANAEKESNGAVSPGS